MRSLAVGDINTIIPHCRKSCQGVPQAALLTLENLRELCMHRQNMIGFLQKADFNIFNKTTLIYRYMNDKFIIKLLYWGIWELSWPQGGFIRYLPRLLGLRRYLNHPPFCQDNSHIPLMVM